MNFTHRRVASVICPYCFCKSSSPVQKEANAVDLMILSWSILKLIYTAHVYFLSSKEEANLSSDDKISHCLIITTINTSPSSHWQEQLRWGSYAGGGSVQSGAWGPQWRALCCLWLCTWPLCQAAACQVRERGWYVVLLLIGKEHYPLKDDVRFFLSRFTSTFPTPDGVGHVMASFRLIPSCFKSCWIQSLHVFLGHIFDWSLIVLFSSSSSQCLG